MRREKERERECLAILIKINLHQSAGATHAIRTNRKKLEIYNCNRVSVPMDVTTGNITKCFISEIEEGKYSLGELIVPIKFKKISVSKDGDLTEHYFYVRGRKNLLHVIRQNSYKSHKPYYLLKSLK